MTKKLKRTRHDNVLAGVCGGIAKYFNIDVTLVRGIWIISSILGGPGLGIYIICAMIIPKESYNEAVDKEPSVKREDRQETSESDEYDDADRYEDHDQETYENEEKYGEEDSDNRNKSFLGLGLISLGAYMTFKIIFPAISFKFLWPVLLIGGGLMLLNNKRHKKGGYDE